MWLSHGKTAKPAPAMLQVFSRLARRTDPDLVVEFEKLARWESTASVADQALGQIIDFFTALVDDPTCSMDCARP